MPPKPSYDRDKLIARARDLFWSKGWAGTSMKDLETVLDMRPGSFYAAFGSKERLYGLTLELYADDGEATLAGLAARLGPLGALRAHLLSFAETGARPTEACFLVRTLSEFANGGSPLARQADALLDAAEARFAALFAEAQMRGEIRADVEPDRLARRYQAQLTGLRATAGRSSANARSLAEDFARDLDALRAHAGRSGA